MSFKDQTFDQRFTKMGDEAEGHFVQFAADTLRLGAVRYGLDRPPIKMAGLPARVRYTPDFLMTKCFVEVQGVGRDQTVKLKLDKHGALHWWNDLRVDSFEGVRFYLWDSANQRECWIHLRDLDQLLAEGKGKLASFPEGKTYFAFNADDIFALAA